MMGTRSFGDRSASVRLCFGLKQMTRHFPLTPSARSKRADLSSLVIVIEKGAS